MTCKQIDTALAEVRRRGLARAVDRPIPGVNAFSAPVFDHSGSIALAITAIGPSGIFDPLGRTNGKATSRMRRSNFQLDLASLPMRGTKRLEKRHQESLSLNPAHPRRAPRDDLEHIVLLGSYSGRYSFGNVQGRICRSRHAGAAADGSCNSSAAGRGKSFVPCIAGTRRLQCLGIQANSWDAPKSCRFCCPAPRWEWSISSGTDFGRSAFRMQGVSLAVGLLSALFASARLIKAPAEPLARARPSKAAGLLCGGLSGFTEY